MRRPRSRLLLSLAALLALASIALAAGEGLDLSWWTVDGGGGTSQGGDYALSGTAGQPEAGPAMSGGPYELAGGFMAASGGEGGARHAVYLPLALRASP